MNYTFDEEDAMRYAIMARRLRSHLAVLPELQRLLAEARDRDVSEEELREQRISFAFGNAPPSDLITKESVRHTAQNIRLCRPLSLGVLL